MSIRWTGDWLSGLERASLQGALGLLVLLIFSRLLPSWRPQYKCWLWRVAYLNLLMALFVNASVEIKWLTVSPRPHPPDEIVSSAAVKAPETFFLPAELTNEPLLGSAEKSPARGTRSWEVLLGAVWASVAGLSAMRLAWSWRWVRRIRRSAAANAIPEIEAALKRMATQLRLAVPRVLVSPLVSEPFVTGIIHPTIVLPAGLVLKDEEMEMVLAHELSHVKRKDLLWNWLPSVAQILLWFHPLVWLGRREWRLAQEMACDEWAVQRRAWHPARYAELLVDFVTQNQIRRNAASSVALGIFSTRSELHWRVIRLRESQQRARRGASVTAYSLVAASLLALVPWRLAANGPEIAPVEQVDQTTEKSKTPGAVSSLADKPSIPAKETGARRDLLEKEIESALKDLIDLRTQTHAGQANSSDVLEQEREYIRLKRDLAYLDNDLPSVRAWLEKDLERIQRLTDEQRKKVQAGAARSNSVNRLERERLRTERELLAISESPRKGDDPVSIEKNSPAIQRLTQEIAIQEADLAALLTRYRDKYPAVQSARRRLAALKAQLSALRNPATIAELPSEPSPRTVTLVSRRAGFVEQVFVQEGDNVKAGEQLLRLDAGEAEQKVRTAEAELKAAEASLRLTEIDLQHAENEKSRTTKLFDNGLISKEEVRNTEQARAKLERSDAEVHVARARLTEAKTELDRYVIRASQAGTVKEVHVHTGEAIAAALTQPAVTLLVDDDKTSRAERLEREIASQQTKLTELNTIYSSESSSVQKARKQLADLKAELDALRLSSTANRLRY